MVSNNSLKSLTFLNWNANGILSKRSIFIHFLESHNIDIACVTETHLCQRKAFNIPNYKCYRNDHSAPAAAGGVAIFIKHSIPYYSYPIPLDHSLELIVIQMKLTEDRNLPVISAYRPPNKPSNFSIFYTLFNTQIPTILLGDLNAKNTNWGCNITSLLAVCFGNLIIL